MLLLESRKVQKEDGQQCWTWSLLKEMQTGKRGQWEYSGGSDRQRFRKHAAVGDYGAVFEFRECVRLK